MYTSRDWQYVEWLLRAGFLFAFIMIWSLVCRLVCQEEYAEKGETTEVSDTKIRLDVEF